MSHFDTRKLQLGSRLLTLSMALVFTVACAKPPMGSLNPDNASSVSSHTVTDLNPPAVELEKVLIEETSSDLAAASFQKNAYGQLQQRFLEKSAMLSAGEKLVVTIDNECARDHLTDLTAEIRNQAQELIDLKLQAYSMQLSQSMSVGELSQLADLDDCIQTISRDGEVRVDAIPNDPSFSQQRQHTAIETAAAYDSFYAATGGISQDVVVAVIDTGMDMNHVDLVANFWKNAQGESGFDFVNSDNMPLDDHGHGTHVSGLVAAVRNNSTGVSGVMGSRAKIMSLKALDAAGSGTYTNVVNAIRFAIANKANVITLSLSGSTTSTAIRSAIVDAVNAGIFVSAAAGNSAKEISTTSWVTPSAYAIDINGFMAVGAIDAISKVKSSFSNFSSNFVEIGSPGSNGILSTTRNNLYGTMSGTSMATPIVAGSAALAMGLIKSRGYTVSAAEIERLIHDSGITDNAQATFFKGGKILNLRSLAAMINSLYPAGGGTPVPTPTTIPTPTTTTPVTTTTRPTTTTVPVTTTTRPPTTTIPAPTTTVPAPTTTVPTGTIGCGTMSKMECDTVKAVNAERAKSVGLVQLRGLSKCTNAAQYHAKDMAAKNYFSHNGLTETVTQRMNRFGLGSAAWGENIAYGYNSVSIVMAAWMSSPGHKANILSSNYRSMGVGVAADGVGRLYWVQCFSGLSGDF